MSLSFVVFYDIRSQITSLSIYIYALSNPLFLQRFELHASVTIVGGLVLFGSLSYKNCWEIYWQSQIDLSLFISTNDFSDEIVYSIS